ncbi:MAG TPA: sugar ABC transporter substrate-binding protein [Microlunatus sp.]
MSTFRAGGPGGVSRRTILKASAAALALPTAGMLAGCNDSSGQSSGEADASGPLTLIYLGDATQQKAFNQLFAAFHKSHPKIEIKATGIAAGDWATFAQTVSTQIAGGKIPDIVDVATEGQRLMASKGLLEPLDDRIAADKDVTTPFFDGIAPNLKDWSKKYGSPDGKTYYIPGGYNTVVMYCNTEVFDKAGVDLPSKDWTWEEFREAGTKIKSKTGAFLLPLGYGFPFVDIMPWLLTNGASTLDADWKNATFASPEAIEAATYVKSLLDAGLSPKPGGTFDAAAQFAKGKLATLGGGRWPTLDIRRLNMTDKTQIVNWPKKTQDGSPAGWDGWPILKASKRKNNSWTFLKWMMSKEAGEFYASVGGTNVPALTEVAKSDVFTKDAPQGTTLMVDAINDATPIPSPDQGAQMQAAVTKGWQAALTGTQPVQAALETANKSIQALL